MRPVSIHDKPVLLPGQCFKCGSSSNDSRDYYADLGIDVDYIGVMYLCEACLSDIVTACPSFYTQREMDDLVDSQREIIESAEASKTKHDAVVNAVETLGLEDFLDFATRVAEDRKQAAKVDELQAKVDSLTSDLVLEQESAKNLAESYNELDSELTAQRKTAEEVSEQLLAVTSEKNVLQEKYDALVKALEDSKVNEENETEDEEVKEEENPQLPFTVDLSSLGK